ncbi:hypothetical protein SEUCBS140593_010642 [Sporothrix eucalyptigena]|uniref:Alpha/beta hydrolase fold-3 domain-containing protein n=1 Tax=Sporothrix eucalyptigena TaxID=1812306 RepID=A0ABP0D4N4_9PEZI
MGMTPLPSLADKLGFVLLYLTPNAQQGITCWDANTAKSLTHDGGSDSQGITGMVAWALKPYDGDTTTKVFVVGDSSGAMESNVLVATYPRGICRCGVVLGRPRGLLGGLAHLDVPVVGFELPTREKGEHLDQWSDMLGVSFSKNISNGPIENRKKIVYGDGTTLVGYEV